MPNPTKTYSSPSPLLDELRALGVPLLSDDGLALLNAKSGAVISQQCAPVTFAPADGNVFAAGGGNVTLASATPGVSIYYTTDGSAPDPTSNLYGGPFAVAVNKTITAIATRAGYGQSIPSAASYTVRVATPTIVPNGGADPAAVNVALACATGGSTIRYTLDGSAPTPAHGTVYAGAFNIVASATLRAIAYKAGMADSLVLVSNPFVIG